MYSFIYVVEGLSFLFMVSGFNFFSRDSYNQPYNQYQSLQEYNPYHSLQEYNQYQSLQEYNPYSLYQKTPTPLSPRYFLFFNNGQNPFSSITFPRVQSCMSIFLPGVHGSCLNIATCFLKGGKPVGKCNFGLKTCCMPLFGSSRLPISTFSKNAFTTQSPATYTIRRSSPKFCGVRLDFKYFDVGNTDPNGNCIGGLVITGESNTNNVPTTICGQNNGTHIYLWFDNGNPITLSVDWTAVTNSSNDWSIKVTQIPCSDTTVPSDCLQYYPESSGTVRSFNFRNVATIPRLPTTTYQISNTDYMVCIGPQTTSTFSQITWSKGVGTTSYYFVLTTNAGAVGPELAGTIAAAEFDDSCLADYTFGTNDYVEIAGGQYTDFNGNLVTTTTQYCGVGFPSTVTSTTTPFRLHVFTNNAETLQTGTVTVEGSVGFSLSYILS